MPTGGLNNNVGKYNEYIEKPEAESLSGTSKKVYPL